MITYTGIRVAPDNDLVPSPRDIAVQMARITRYGGAVWCPLLAHSVLVAGLVLKAIHHVRLRASDLPTWAWGLLHDAHEVVTGEVVRPWKPDGLRARQAELDRRIRDAFHLDESSIDLAMVKAMDERALIAEAVVLQLPNFARAYTEIEDLAEFPAPARHEVDLMEALRRSPFFDPSSCLAPEAAPAVVGVEEILSEVRRGDLASAFEGWEVVLGDLLPEVRLG